MFSIGKRHRAQSEERKNLNQQQQQQENYYNNNQIIIIITITEISKRKTNTFFGSYLFHVQGFARFWVGLC